MTSTEKRDLATDTAGIREDIGILRSGQSDIESFVKDVYLEVRTLRGNDLALVRGSTDLLRDRLGEIRAGQIEIRDLLTELVRRLDAVGEAADHT
uniref:hypothetical protein n=1 Tax=Herbidospora sakaeratensis TaxID=564415 RepID=UPI000781DE5B|nr:hypothetical protein [Herbidospora sakaeratensis]